LIEDIRQIIGEARRSVLPLSTPVLPCFTGALANASSTKFSAKKDAKSVPKARKAA